MKYFLILTLLFNLSAFAYDTQIECRISDERTDLIEIDLEEAIYNKKAINSDYVDGLAELTETLEDGDYASVSPEDLEVSLARCSNCYMLRISSFLNPKLPSGGEPILSRYLIPTEVRFAETAPLQIYLKIMPSYFYDLEKGDYIEIECKQL